MSYKISNIELRSEKVRNLLGEIPPALVRYGTVIIVAIFLMLLLIVCFMPYPYSNGESICLLYTSPSPRDRG